MNECVFRDKGNAVAMAVDVVDEAKFGVIVLAAPLDRLPDITICGDGAIGGVGVGGADIAGLAVDPRRCSW